ncbi:MAG: type II toxin-antitoxin system RelE/ParE family toxin [Proteobacteria bacterium]|nr:type II toxin-antitoxin system RelE/ParE family toxin [Pseudomonadota bacterium]NOG61209.1 type II toxin-antitoxin system RelE/ParE family toxin [Pseudomonadota bacterium]
MKIVWTEPAANALEEIQDYIAKDDPAVAYDIAIIIRTVVQNLSSHPKMGRKGRVVNTYELVISDIPYIVVYRMKPEEIHILSVFHTSRKWPEQF